MTAKAYIVANEQQEREVLEKFENKGLLWRGRREKPTYYTPRKEISGFEFPYALINREELITYSHLLLLDDEIEIAFDGRKEEQMSDKYVVSQEFMNELEEWRKNNNLINNFVGYVDLGNVPAVVAEWWKADMVNTLQTNNRLIAIIRWVNGEDVFEVEKPKKWVVRSKELNVNGDRHYGVVAHFGNLAEINYFAYDIENATKFKTKEEAESWANSHQEVIEVEE
ncbi:hypothetical protein [Weissella paramesenteroides]|uniref:hypothetical protein n=1 Tax=Weissella paramesenteroides TaxID=1249 RepID=UPI002E7B757F|nr:hypothetical protein [Weissella paramesenteroides]WPQ68409.1 hypothetical protein QRX23_02085 [Weissella paramesenteroides]